MSTEVLEKLRLRASLRAVLLEPLTDARAAEARAMAAVEEAFEAWNASLDLYEGTDDEIRLRVRARAADLEAAHRELTGVRVEVDRAVHTVRTADCAAGNESRQLFSSALLQRASAAVALDLLSPATCSQLARGEATTDTIRVWLAGIEGTKSAAAELRAAGGRARDLHPAIFLLPVLEAFCADGRAPIPGNSLFTADVLPRVDRPHEFGEWLRRAADGPAQPAAVLANMRQRLASVRAAVLAGCRWPDEIERWESERGHQDVPRPAPTMAPSRPNESSGTHRPAERTNGMTREELPAFMHKALEAGRR